MNSSVGNGVNSNYFSSGHMLQKCCDLILKQKDKKGGLRELHWNLDKALILPTCLSQYISRGTIYTALIPKIRVIYCRHKFIFFEADENESCMH